MLRNEIQKLTGLTRKAIEYYEENDNVIQERLALLENEETIYERLERAFPGYFGMMIFSAYQPFLSEPLKESETSAYNEYINYLDSLPTFELSEEERDYIEKNTAGLGINELKDVNNAKIKAVEDIKQWWTENKDVVTKYEEFKNSDEYASSLMKKIYDKLKKYMEDNNYYEIAIPLIRQFSKTYDDYYKKLLEANDEYMKLRKI